MSNFSPEVDGYIAGFPAEIQAMMKSVRQAIHEAVPEIQEKFSWRMPTFHTGKILVQFAGFRNHIGFFPGPDAIEAFTGELAGFKTSKGGIHFPYSRPVPTDLVKKITIYKRDSLATRSIRPGTQDND